MKLTHCALICAAAGVIINKPYITPACMLCSSAFFFVSFIKGIKKLRKELHDEKQH